MTKILSLAALALGAALLALPASPQAATLKLDGLHQQSPVQTIAMSKKKKKVAKKPAKKKAVAKRKKRKPAKA